MARAQAVRSSRRSAAASRGTPDLGKVSARVLRWFDEHGRPFPWRETRDPYRIMVAEVMLQQTQTGRVAPAYATFLEHFPTLSRLAHAPAIEVIKAWRGLGYNRRAVDLQRAAQAIEHDDGGGFPHDIAALRALPGVGEYSAAAISCFAFDAQVAVVDSNVRRVLARAALGKDADEASVDQVRRVARAWLPAGDAYRWNQALMDVGATLCRPERPLCVQCPLKATCGYHAAGRHRAPRAPRVPVAEPFEGSRRQKRGGIIDHLREAAAKGVTLGALARAIHPGRIERDLSWLVELLEGLAADGLVEMSPSAGRGSPRGIVRLPH